MSYRPSTNFVDNSNKNKKVCKNHLFSVWGEGFERCVQGNKFNQECEELKQEEKVVSER